MHQAHWITLIAWWVYVAEPAAALDRATGQVYPTFQWVRQGALPAQGIL